MVVAYLRGLLPKHHPYSVRSALTEEVILEALAADKIAANMELSVAKDVAMLPVLNEKGITSTLERSNVRAARASELRLLNIYKVEDQIGGRLRGENSKQEISLYQLYQLASKKGIFEAFDEHYKEEDSKPLL